MTALTWLTPARRKGIYGVLAAAATIAVAVGAITDVQSAAWLGILQSGLSLAAVVMAAVAARRWDVTALYAGCAALAAAIVTAGFVEQATADAALGVLSQVMLALPLLGAFLRTDPSTPTGEPAVEYDLAA